MWLARDKDNSLWLYSDKPSKQKTSWENFYSQFMELDPNLFDEVKWEDEPVEVKITINVKQ